MPKPKYYVVWKGRQTGVFSTWEECERQVKGFFDAQYKAFPTRSEAETAFRSKYAAYRGRSASAGRWKHAEQRPLLPSLCVDGACRGPVGPMEYRCVRTEDGEQLFRAGPFAGGTNNVAEFLAIVHALEWIEKRSLRLPVYSDSENAISWVIAGACKTHLKRTARNASIFALIHSAEGWLEENRLRDGAVRKWETERWGENPADFGRK